MVESGYIVAISEKHGFSHNLSNSISKCKASILRSSFKVHVLYLLFNKFGEVHIVELLLIIY